ncbi:MAG: PilZ domain-containing protein [Planctomycetota bacterium]
MSDPIPFRERRRFVRYDVPPMYSPIAIRTLDRETFDFDGHAYDVSEGGICFELDRAFEPATRVGIRIELPGPMAFGRSRRCCPGADVGPGRAIFALGTIVWTGDEDEFGPCRMAAVFNMFCRVGDQERLRRALGQTYALAA